jgi:hypothetical protein
MSIGGPLLLLRFLPFEVSHQLKDKIGKKDEHGEKEQEKRGRDQ